MILLHFFFLQAKAFRSNEEDDDDDTDDDFSEDEELQSPIDDIDPFIFFVDTIKGTSYSVFISNLKEILLLFELHTYYYFFFKFLNEALQVSDPLRFQNLTHTLDFHYQAIANGIAQHADVRRVEIEKEKMEKASSTPASAS